MQTWFHEPKKLRGVTVEWGFDDGVPMIVSAHVTTTGLDASLNDKDREMVEEELAELPDPRHEDYDE